MITPEGTEVRPSFGKILVAWNGSKEFTSAIAASLPLLKSARQIEIFDIRMGSKDLIERNSLRDYLACHRLLSSTSVRTIESQAIDSEIIEKIKSDDADL